MHLDFLMMARIISIDYGIIFKG